MKMSRSTYKSLLRDLRRNDLRNFRSTFEKQGLPRDNNWYDYDLLMKALHWNHKRIVNYLLDQRCRVNKPFDFDTRVDTPLHLAAGKLGWGQVVEKLLRLQARMTDTNAEGNTPLHLAFINGLSKYVIYLLLRDWMEKYYLNIENDVGLSLLHIASATSNCDYILELLCVANAPISNQISSYAEGALFNYAGYTALHFAVKAGKHEIAELLCKFNADPYDPDYRHNSSAVHLALENRDVRMVDLLLGYDRAYENYSNYFNASRFMAACIGSHVYVVEDYLNKAKNSPDTLARCMVHEQILDCSTYPNAGYNCLHFASEFGRYNTVSVLLMNGAHFAMTIDHLTPLDLALRHQRYDICYLLERHIDICERCYNLTRHAKTLRMNVDMENEDIDNLKNDTIFGFSRDKIFTFAKTFALTNFLRLCENLYESL